MLRLANPQKLLQAARRAAHVRPTSPHLSIYQPQLTWLMSIAHRVTGAGLAAGLYAFGLYYAIARPPRGLAERAAAKTAARVPEGAMAAARAAAVAPLAYHLLNGVRHLAWDAGFLLSIRGVYVGGWAVNALTAAAAAYAAYPRPAN